MVHVQEPGINPSALRANSLDEPQTQLVDMGPDDGRVIVVRKGAGEHDGHIAGHGLHDMLVGLTHIAHDIRFATYLGSPKVRIGVIGELPARFYYRLQLLGAGVRLAVKGLADACTDDGDTSRVTVAIQELFGRCGLAHKAIVQRDAQGPVLVITQHRQRHLAHLPQAQRGSCHDHLEFICVRGHHSELTVIVTRDGTAITKGNYIQSGSHGHDQRRIAHRHPRGHEAPVDAVGKSRLAQCGEGIGLCSKPVDLRGWRERLHMVCGHIKGTKSGENEADGKSQ